MKVALNPRNTDAGSFFDPETGVNLFLGSPISEDVSGKNIDNLIEGINCGTLIVVDGDIPEGIKPPVLPMTRSRWCVVDKEGNEINPSDLTKKWDKFLEKLSKAK